MLFEAVGGPRRPLKHTGGMTRRSLHIRRLSTFFPARSPTLNGRLTKRGGGVDAKKTILSAEKKGSCQGSGRTKPVTGGPLDAIFRAGH